MVFNPLVWLSSFAFLCAVAAALSLLSYSRQHYNTASLSDKLGREDLFTEPEILKDRFFSGSSGYHPPPVQFIHHRLIVDAICKADI